MTRPKGSIREQIDQRRFHKPMRQALRRVLSGQTYREAADAEQIDHAHLWRSAMSIEGLCEEHLRAWRASWGDELPEVWQHHLQKIQPAPSARWQH
jgi:homospermidine synthase